MTRILDPRFQRSSGHELKGYRSPIEQLLDLDVTESIPEYTRPESGMTEFLGLRVVCFRCDFGHRNYNAVEYPEGLSCPDCGNVLAVTDVVRGWSREVKWGFSQKLNMNTEDLSVFINGRYANRNRRK